MVDYCTIFYFTITILVLLVTNPEFSNLISLWIYAHFGLFMYRKYEEF